MKRFGRSSLVAGLLGLSAALVFSFFVQLPAYGQGQRGYRRGTCVRRFQGGRQPGWAGSPQHSP